MPNLRQLEYLVAIDEARHFRRAAELANTTQPTLSEQLKALETRLGAQLVERSRARVVLTPVGRQVATIARRMLADADEIRSLAASGGRELTGVLRLGLPPTIGPYLLPLLIPRLGDAFQDLKLYVREEVPSGLVHALREGRHDLVVTLLPLRHGDVESETLFREPLYLAVRHDHPLAAHDTVTRAHLKDQDVLALGQGHQLHDAVLALCEDCEARLRFDYEGTSLDTLREMVAMGMGVTFLPGLYVNAVAARDRSLRILPLADRAVFRTVALVWRKASGRASQYREFADFVRNVVGRESIDYAPEDGKGMGGATAAGGPAGGTTTE